jgi:branched-chain amino acid transport system ATP-binding protein
MEKVYELFPILKERQKQISGTLSGGEQQMLAMGRGLMSNPDIILLDEQNAYKALKIASRAYVLEQGVITLEGNAVDIAANPKIQEAYLGLFKKHTRN